MKGGKGGNGTLPAPLTAPQANGATSTLGSTQEPESLRITLIQIV